MSFVFKPQFKHKFNKIFIHAYTTGMCVMVCMCGTNCTSRVQNPGIARLMPIFTNALTLVLVHYHFLSLQNQTYHTQWNPYEFNSTELVVALVLGIMVT